MAGKITIGGRGTDMAKVKALILEAIGNHDIVEAEVEVLLEPEPSRYPWHGPHGLPIQHRVVGKRVALVLGNHIEPASETSAADAPEDDPFAAGGWQEG